METPLIAFESVAKIYHMGDSVVIAANMWGKFKTVSQMIMTILIILDIEELWLLTDIFIYLALALTVISLEEYIRQNIHVLKEGKV